MIIHDMVQNLQVKYVVIHEHVILVHVYQYC